jgi:hypothetical protein
MEGRPARHPRRDRCGRSLAHDLGRPVRAA